MSNCGRSFYTPRHSISSQKSSSGYRKSSISEKSALSAQILISGTHNSVERYSQPLPVLVTEALTFTEKNAVVSARISPNGYAWVVCGRRLLIWQYRKSVSSQCNSSFSKRSGLVNQCYELQLPQSDLAQRAELVSVLVDSSTAHPSCVAVSPEGMVRYWASIVHDCNTVEQSIDLNGQECDSLTEIEGIGCLLTTTTCTVVLIYSQITTGRPKLKVKALKPPTGWLGGLGKRMSSLIFGPNTNDHSLETRLVRVLSIPSQNDNSYVYVLAGHSLQKWRLSKNSINEDLILCLDLSRLARDCFQPVLWEHCNGDHSEIDMWILDLQSDNDNIIILAAAVNISSSPRIHYGMICLDTNGDQPNSSIKDFYLLNFTDLFGDETTNEALMYRFLLCGTSAYLYNQRSVIVIKPQDDPDILEFHSPNDCILAGIICVNTPLFFTRINGIVSVMNNDSKCDFNMSTYTTNAPVDSVSINDTTVINNLSVYNMDPDEMYNSYKDTLNQFKAAFVYHIKRQTVTSSNILHTIFPKDVLRIPGIDSVLDKITISACTDLLDDIPASDPRWNSIIAPGTGSSYTMQVLHQLEDKQKAYHLYVNFLKETSLWSRLSAVTIRNNTAFTVHYIGELIEKLAAALALKRLSANEFLEDAIHLVVNKSGEVLENGLTHQDLFYRRVSQVHRVFHQIVDVCENKAHSHLSPQEIVDVVVKTNDIILKVLKDVLQVRYNYKGQFIVSEEISSIQAEYLPWTASSGSDGIADCILQLYHLTYNYGIKMSSNDIEKQTLFVHLMEIIDILLDGRKAHIESISDENRKELSYKQYCVDKQAYIKPLLEGHQWERAAQLAEKYLDFETLVFICYSTNNQDRLDNYIEQFSNEGFANCAYNWFIKHNQQAKLINRCRTTSSVQEKYKKLRTFLMGQPSLSWIQNMFDHDFHAAADTLEKLGKSETESLLRQKTVFSLCKLAKLATSGTNLDGNSIKDINDRLELITFQEDIPDYVLQHYGYDMDTLRVIPPNEIANLYICNEHKEANELHFKKALDLLRFISGTEMKQDMLLKIWRQAILRDNWVHSSLDNPLDILQEKLFFRLVDIIMSLEGNVLDLLPPLDLLTDDELFVDLQKDINFQFLIKTGYDHIYQTYST